MHGAVKQLLAMCGEPIQDAPSDFTALRERGPLGEELAELLEKADGFYAFHSALLVRPFSNPYPPLGIVQWNEPSLWKQDYSKELDECLFFAEDVFGGQFGLRKNDICSFAPETGEIRPVAKSLEAWARYLLTDSAVATGEPLSAEWQATHGRLPCGQRLLPKLPFVVGGAYEAANLYALSDVEGMKFRASLAAQIRDLPDGAAIVLKKRVEE